MLEKVQADRQAKLEKIRQLGIDPYGGRYDTAAPVAEIHEGFEDREGGEDQPADAAGRLVLMRDMGKLIFAHLRDQSGQMQVAFRRDALSETAWQLVKLLDLGDLVAVRGKLMRTRAGEITIFADELTLLCKSLDPMPEKFHGLRDTETRYRRRYLDLMTNPQSLEVFRKRSEIIEQFRRSLAEQGFREVETPMLQQIYGGAAARPFVTHHNTLDMDLFLRISPELFLKRLLVGGMEKVFEINRNFRNEGIDTTHNPEFTMMELYQARADYAVMMDLTESLISDAARHYAEHIPAQAERFEQEADRLEQANQGALRAVEAGKADADAAAVANERRSAEAAELRARAGVYARAAERIAQGRVALPYGDEVIDYTAPWRRCKYADLLAEHAGVAMWDIPAVRAKAKAMGLDPENKDDAVVINDVFEETVERHLVQPTFVIDYPADICPLTRRRTDDPRVAERFELFIANMEIANAYTELNDPAVQQENFARQLRGEAENETMRVMDEDFVRSLRHGMPPAGGLGMGIDRVVMLLADRQSIRDVVLFPMLREQVAAPAEATAAAGDDSATS